MPFWNSGTLGAGSLSETVGMQVYGVIRCRYNIVLSHVNMAERHIKDSRVKALVTSETCARVPRDNLPLGVIISKAPVSIRG